VLRLPSARRAVASVADELALEARTDGAVLQVGTRSCTSAGRTARRPGPATVFVAQTVGTGNFDKWTDGPALPAPRADASVAYVAGSISVIGGDDAAGDPTDTVSS
jgi:hypothetical protein